MAKPKVIIAGMARHGKDTACEYLRDKHGFTFESSSHILLEEVVYPKLKDKYGYASPEECYADRGAHRAEWFNLLEEYNTPDLTRLGRLIFSKYDIYCGLRNVKEFRAMKEQGLFDYHIWIDASRRVALRESSSSITLTHNEADIIVDNNGSLKELYTNLDLLAVKIKTGEWEWRSLS